jgi:hypothetical protein
MSEKKGFCELVKEQLTDEDKAGEIYETAKKLLQEQDIGWGNSDWIAVPAGDGKWKMQRRKEEDKVGSLKTVPTSTDYAVLEKVASDERSHKILLRVLTERLCP